MSDARPVSIWWIRRDLRLADNPALGAAVHDGDGVVPLYVLDPALLRGAGTARRAWLLAALHALDREFRDAGGPGLSVVRGQPRNAVLRAAQAVSASTVHIAADFGPYGQRRDAAVAEALAAHGIELRATGSPYAVAPGTLENQSSRPFQVFTPFFRSWSEHGVHAPAPTIKAADVDWVEVDHRIEIPAAEEDLIARAGEGPALAAWQSYVQDDVTDYEDLHNDPGADGTSHLSIALRWGHIHPRTVLADLAPKRSKGAAALARQICWRDFFADVLFHRPDATTQPIRAEFAKMRSEDPGHSTLVADHLEAWQQGRTGFPLVDAGMRQLLAEGWMHNRVRMVVASFLIKDLHIGWWHGADWFMDRLYDGDIAQNQMNWQWVAGSGMDAAPYFRIFNPKGQAEKFDPDGSYIRRYVPELREVPTEHIHQPSKAPDGPPDGYPAPIVDHAAERKESLERYAEIRS